MKIKDQGMMTKHSFENLEGYLNGCLLIAMPLIIETRFEQSIVFICGHDANGAIGLMLNKPLPSVYLSELFKQLKVSPNPLTANTPLFFGGPIEMNRGFVLHSLDYLTDNTVVVNMDFGVTATVDILTAIAEGRGPKQYRISLGYTGWNSGQLEHELQDNRWLTQHSTPELIFNTDSHLQWKKSIQNIGFEEGSFPIHGGHA
jgi:putative transcriptional regulator